MRLLSWRSSIATSSFVDRMMRRRIRGLWFHSLEEHARMGEILERLVDEAQQPPPPPPPAAPAVAASLMGALSVNEPAAPLLSPSLFAPPAPAPVAQKPAAPSLDLATFKDGPRARRGRRLHPRAPPTATRTSPGLRRPRGRAF